jgi:hypothetical protein
LQEARAMKRAAGLALLGSMIVTTGKARAESAIAPVGCTLLAAASPDAGVTVPANLPAFVFRPARYALTTRPIERFALGLREVGGAPAVPITIERLTTTASLLGLLGSGEDYLVKPQRPLKVGDVVLGFDDDCGPYTGSPLAAPTRNQRYTYHVGPAVPLPTRTGTAALRKVSRQDDPFACDAGTAHVEVALDERLAVFPLLAMEARSADGRQLLSSFTRLSAGVVTADIRFTCGPSADAGFLPPGSSVVSLQAEILGGAKLAPAQLTIAIDCTLDAGTCDKPASPDAGDRQDTGAVRDGVVADGVPVPAPDGRGTADASEREAGESSDSGVLPGGPVTDGRTTTGPDRDAGAQVDGADGVKLAGAGCGCTTGGRGARRAGWLFLLAGAALVRRARAATRAPVRRSTPQR